MGYTHYWRQTADLNQAEWAEITDRALTLLLNLPGASESAGGYHSDEPLILAHEGDQSVTIDGEEIWFNGAGDAGHETFQLTRKRREPNEWETKPSDALAPFTFCKTARKPYDLAVCAVLIVASSLSSAWNVTSDGEVDDWVPALRFVDSVLPEYRWRLPAGVEERVQA